MNRFELSKLKMSKSKRTRISYYKRIFSAYLISKNSHLSFWHGTPQVNENAPLHELGEYYMPFLYKAEYPGPFDNQGIPLLDYKGNIGKQYNPIAIAQYALGQYNLYKRTNSVEHFDKFLKQANWLVEHLQPNAQGLYVWNHHFDWEYREGLKAPWYSALSQGQGISVLVRTFIETGDKKYVEAAEKAFETFNYEIPEGGVSYTDENGHIWFEEGILLPPTHILNGFIWAIWGIYDFYLHTKGIEAKKLFEESVKTLKTNLKLYDIGFWSLYELTNNKLKMIASHFYHSLHIVQLRVMYKITEEKLFSHFADKWDEYNNKKFNRNLALIYKAIFKLVHY